MKLILVLMISIAIMIVADADEPKKIVPASEVLAKIQNGQPVEYDHVTITGDMDLGKLGLQSKHVDRSDFEKELFHLSENLKIVRSPLRIKDSEIDGVVNFSSTIFENLTDFSGTSFKSHVDFNNSNFTSDADFRDTLFKSDADFFFSNFNSGAIFWGTYFNSGALFSNTHFNSDAFFLSVNFDSGAYFSASNFNGQADFRYSNFNSTTYLMNSQFGKGADFDDAIFNGRCSFENSQFKGDTIFETTKFNSDLSLTRTRYDKLYIRWYNIKNRQITYNDAAYLALLMNFKNLGYLEDYDYCYYAYRTAHRDQPWPLVGGIEEVLRKRVDYLLGLFYGYGTRPLNALGFSVAVIFIFGIAWRTAGLGTRDWPPVARLNSGSLLWHALIFSLTVFLSGTKLFIDPPDMPVLQGRSASLVRCAFIAERALGAFFSILFFLAISSTIVR